MALSFNEVAKTFRTSLNWEKIRIFNGGFGLFIVVIGTGVIVVVSCTSSLRRLRINETIESTFVP
jgi:uncharacterized membrane protein required for colicin V production